ncbi:MAG: transcription-repair coupling factor [Bacillota bacterium]|nr:transcription-repair coupling factor [Bacillota bacterium]
MPLPGVLDLALESPEVQSFARSVSAGVAEQMVSGLAGSQRTCAFAAVRRHAGRPVLIVTDTLTAAERIAEDMEAWLGEPVLVFPALEVLPFEVVAQSEEMAVPRISTLERLTSGQRPVVVAPVTALLRRLPPPQFFAGVCIDVTTGSSVDTEDIIMRLVLGGYERVEMVEGRGQFSRRGGILDVFAPDMDNPARLELFEDMVDSIRHFDLGTQRSVDSLQTLRIPPARELVAPSVGFDEALDRIRRATEVACRKHEAAGRKQAAQKLQDKVAEHLEKIETSRSFEGLDQYAPFFYTSMCSLLDYMPTDTVVMVDEYARLRDAVSEIEKVFGDMYSALVEQGSLLPGQTTVYMAFDDVVDGWRHRQVLYFSLLLRRIQNVAPQNVVSVQARSAQTFHGQWPAFVQEVSRWKRGAQNIILVCASEDRATRLSTQLRDEGIENIQTGDLNVLPEPGVISVATASLESGFELPGVRLILVTDAEIYGRPRRARRVRASRDAQRLADYRELRTGDYVVHVNHGIGQYMGVRTLEIEKTQRDYLFIKYQGADALYVPTDQIHMIQKYVGAEGHEPKLNRLGGTEWARVKHRVRESVRQMAQELLRLYAVRESIRGYQFSADTPWQGEFEDTFMYEETPDQLQASEAIKRDMEKPRPMDRLLCGDVGYGKTEVALRAAFKAIMDGKQVALLVPTTILAQQHFNTMKDRFAGFPVKVAMMSRFLSSKEQADVAKSIKQGLVDVTVGTHRLLQSDVAFKDLGLLVVDEEHRFGVGHKEQVKQLKLNVDVLTLTATPIPRTLSMALSGIRDMSLIETPPEDRLPVQTYVLEYNDELVRDAIIREIARGGQVFYVHNRVQSIQRGAEHVQSLVPQARIAVAHGQMKEDALEQVMIEFLAGEHDILVCTTIIESGLDMANVNTLIVENADHLGLAQLYQLRGRVGRSNRLAYAYFTYRKERVLTETSEKRLQAVRELTELGSGFKLALRDLEIRGAGNVLGPEQHGFIISVGFDLYVQLLDEAIRELKGEKAPPEAQPVSIDIAQDAFIPDTYVQDPRQKIDLYKKIVAIESIDDADEVAEELLDRYGHPPAPVQNLLSVARIKVQARHIGVTAISQQKDRLMLKLGETDKPKLEKIVGFLRGLRGRFTVSIGRMPTVVMRLESPSMALHVTEQLVRRLNEVAR